MNRFDGKKRACCPHPASSGLAGRATRRPRGRCSRRPATRTPRNLLVNAGLYRQRGRVARTLIAALVAVALIAVLALLTLREPAVKSLSAEELPFVAVGRVDSIDDGDSFVFVTPAGDGRAARRVHVRLHAIDTPELVQTHGWSARSALARLLNDDHLRVDCYKRDVRGRAVCRVRAGSDPASARDVELALLEDGHAWHYEAYAREQTVSERERYASAMNAARAAGRGLWQHDAPLAPWRCRERLRAGQPC